MLGGGDEPPITGHDATSRDNRLMPNWRLSQATPDERRIIRSMSRKRQPLGQTAMTRVITQQSAENMAYVRKLLKPEMPGQVSVSEDS